MERDSTLIELDNILLEGQTRKYWWESWKQITLTSTKLQIGSTDYPLAQISNAYISSEKIYSSVIYYLNFDFRNGHSLTKIFIKDSTHPILAKWSGTINYLISRREAKPKDAWLCVYCKMPNSGGCSCS